MTSNSDTERFRSGADKYAAYLQSREGQLRLDLSFANLQEFLPNPPERLMVLDIGAGPGAMAIRLARLGAQVTLLDASLPMLDLANRAALEAGVSGRIKLIQANAIDMESLFPARSFDVILCHNMLEYVEDPCTMLGIAANGLRDSFSIISVLVRNQAGEVLKSAIQLGDLDAAERNLTAEWANESLYGGRVRLFAAGSLRTMMEAASLAVAAERGVRVVSDYVSQTISANEHARIFRLEHTLGQRPDFAGVARYTQCIARRIPPSTVRS